MNRAPLLQFLLVLAVVGLIGGFVGAEWSSSDRTFSPTGALVAAVATAAILLGLGAFFDRQDRKKRRSADLPPEIRDVMSRMMGARSAPKPADPSELARESLRRRMEKTDPARIKAFVSTILALGVAKDAASMENLARTELLVQRDPVIAALTAQRKLLDALLDRSRGEPSVMGTSIAASCFGVCELVVDGKVQESVGREHFESYVKVFDRVHGIKMPFSGGPLDFYTSLELAKEARSQKGRNR